MDKIGIIKRPIERELSEFKALFDAALTSTAPILGDVLGYIRKRNGKMMRPMLVLLMAKLYGKINPATLHSALSLELLHTASLVHDDVVDKSDKRRGQASVNALYDNRVSVLVGDYMLATSLRHAAYTKEIELVDLVARLGQNLSEGEIVQLANTSNTEFSEEIYFDVIRKKTAALFTASAESGALSVKASAEDVDNAALFGEMTLPALYVLNEKADEEKRELALRIRSLKASHEEIASFVSYVKQEGGIEYADRVMHDYRDKALALLPQQMDESLRTALTAYVDYVVDRTK